MFRSLRGRLLILFSLIILLTVVLTGVLSLWTTFDRFSTLVTDEGQYQAQEIAPLLEANYAYWNGWQGLDDLLNFMATDAVELFAPLEVGADWWLIAAEALGLEEDALIEKLDNSGSLAEVAIAEGVEPDTLVGQITEIEQQNMAEAVAAGHLTPEEADEEMRVVSELAHGFIWDSWDEAGGEISALDVYSPALEPAWTTEGIDWLLSTLFFEQDRLLIADAEGVVLFDSIDELSDEALADSLLEQGAEMLDPRTGDFIGTVVVATGPEQYSAQETAFLEGVAWSLVISGLVAGIVALLAGWMVARRVTEPVAALTQAARRLAAGVRPERLPVHTDDELGQMSAAFNQMADALDTQQALRTRLVDDITHELHTPLSVIQLELQALDDNLQTPEQTVRQVHREIDMLRDLVEDLTLLTETEGEKAIPKRQPTDLMQLTAEAVQRWSGQAEAAGVTLHLSPTADLIPPIEADPRRLAQALGNLIANALQHSRQGDRVEIRCELAATPNPTRIQPRQHGSERATYVLTTVSDTGAGIAEQDLPFIFERFYRTDRSRSRRTGGRGLGLAIVREVIAQHGGEVWVTSKVGEGSTFGYSLPVE